MKADMKICSKCNKSKSLADNFYVCGGRYRGECKICTVKRNVRYQRGIQAWKHRYGDDESRKKYMREYYSKNKDKFAQYRLEFREKHPEYYKQYFRDRKNKR